MMQKGWDSHDLVRTYNSARHYCSFARLLEGQDNMVGILRYGRCAMSLHYRNEIHGYD